MNDPFAQLPGIPPEMMAAAQAAAGPMQKDIFQFLAKKMGGKTIFKTKEFHDVGQIVKWLNDNKNVHTISLLPNYSSYSYHLIYEEADASA